MTNHPNTSSFLTALLATSVLAVAIPTTSSAMDLGGIGIVGGEGSRSFVSGNAIGGAAFGGAAISFNQSGWGSADTNANATSAAQGHVEATGEKSGNLLSHNAFSAPGPGEHAFDAKHGAIGSPALHHKKHGHGMFSDRTFARLPEFPLPEFPSEPGAEATPEPPSSPVEELAEVAPTTLQEFDDEQSDFNQSCQDVLVQPAANDDDAVRVCWVLGSP
jgi:hypothetical protein